MISRSFYSWGDPVGHQRYGCGMKKPDENYAEDYCCIGITSEKHCKTYYEGGLSNVHMVYDKSGVETEVICNSEQDTSTIAEVTTTAAKTTESSTTSQDTTDSVLVQNVFGLGLLILIST